MKMKFYESIEGHKILDEKYWPEKLKEYLEKEDKSLIENISENSAVLDVGSGEGRHLKLLYKKCKKLFGIDYSKTMSDYSKRVLSGLGNVVILNEDIKDSEFPKKSFDFIICMFNTFGNLDSETQKIFLQKISDFIKPNGTIYLSVYSDKAKETQIEFYNKIGLVVKGSDEDFVYTDGFISERFSKDKIKRIIENAGLKIKNIVELNDISLLLEIEKGDQ
jgi:SAM-dependent methyltransferase